MWFDIGDLNLFDCLIVFFPFAPARLLQLFADKGVVEASLFGI